MRYSIRSPRKFKYPRCIEIRLAPRWRYLKRLARLLLNFGSRAFHWPGVKQGAAWAAHFEPGGVFFWDRCRFNLLACAAIRHAAFRCSARGPPRSRFGVSEFGISPWYRVRSLG